MRRQTLVVWSSICFCLLLVLVVAKAIGETDDVHLKVSIRMDTLNGAPSCQHTFSQIELLNSVSRRELDVTDEDIMSDAALYSV